ncbi:uncharacterized protein LOC103477438 isoform X1 [Poecilia reticulata]|uniref:uncharacterized protein LOC103477438 isoform X1 n=1 Tax=Poecilia reticulata TaxID=8081 RepID=UPI0007E92A34|nr:PREDICTED: acetyl-coenzyme A synthetase 2-like, mitochondrial isoform X1 [Poecilia reticulata]
MDDLCRLIVNLRRRVQTVAPESIIKAVVRGRGRSLSRKCGRVGRSVSHLPVQAGTGRRCSGCRSTGSTGRRRLSEDAGVQLVQLSQNPTGTGSEWGNHQPRGLALVPQRGGGGTLPPGGHLVAGRDRRSVQCPPTRGAAIVPGHPAGSDGRPGEARLESGSVCSDRSAWRFWESQRKGSGDPERGSDPVRLNGRNQNWSRGTCGDDPGAVQHRFWTRLGPGCCGKEQQNLFGSELSLMTRPGLGVLRGPEVQNHL